MTPPRHLTWIELEPSTEALKKAQDAFKNKNQIVQTDQGQKTAQPAKDAFLGERTQTVDRETVSIKKTTVIGQSHRRASKTAQAAPALPIVGNLGVQIVPKQNHTPSDEQVAHEENWADQGGGSPEDYVKGIKESDRTALNTKEFVFFGYYQRIRQRLDRAWVPILREKIEKYYNSGRHLASEMDHTTKVLVVLNPQGEITKVRVVSQSGTRDLDDAAVAAFNQAGPFPNPPRGMIGADGVITIPWEFVLRT